MAGPARGRVALAELEAQKATNAAEARIRRLVDAIGNRGGDRLQAEAWLKARRLGLSAEFIEEVLGPFARANPDFLYVAGGDRPVTPLSPFVISEREQ